MRVSRGYSIDQSWREQGRADGEEIFIMPSEMAAVEEEGHEAEGAQGQPA